jgi:hypothetical protein
VNGCLKASWELSWSAIEAILGHGEIFGWRGMMRKEFFVVGDEQERCGDVAPIGPDLVLNLGIQAVEFADADGVTRRNLC